MRRVLKNMYLWAVTGLLLTGCSSSDDGGDPPTEPATVGITSFGFYQADNQGVLFNDYVVEDIPETESSISVDLPGETDLTALVARFSTTDGDVVKVGAVMQESGVTANNFTGSVEYLVSESETNKIYTVSVGKMAAAVWSQLSVFSEDVMTDLSMKIDPTSSVPYFAYISDRESTADRKLNLVGYEGDNWTRTGSMDFSPARARSVELEFSNDGTPYISFGDDAEGTTQGSVMTYDSGSWSYVGGGPYTGGKSSVNSLSIGENGTVYAFYLNDQNGSADRRKVFAATNDGGAWQDLPITGRTGIARAIQADQVNGTTYLSVLDYGDLQHISVYKYEEGQWTVLADHMKDSPENTIYYYHIAMAADAEGNVYMAYAENAGPDTDYQLKIKKYDVETGNWANHGDIITTTELRDFDIAVNGYGDAMVLYKNDSENPVVTTFDSDVNNWGSHNILLNDVVDDLNIGIAPDGIGYASFISASAQAYLFKYDSPDNE